MSKNIPQKLTQAQRAELAAQVKTARIQSGMTQQELADAAGVTRQSVGNIESGDRVPQEQTLIPVLEALNISAKPAVFSASTSKWLAIVGGIMDALPEGRRPAAGHAAVAAVTAHLAAANVGGEVEDEQSLEYQREVALAARKRSKSRGEDHYD